MSYARFKMYSSLVLISALGVMSGCGDDGKWFEGMAAQALYEAQAGIDAIDAGADPFSVDKSCEVIIKLARESLDHSAEAVTGIQAMAKPCNDAGLEFGNKLRCESGRLQVLCR